MVMELDKEFVDSSGSSFDTLSSATNFNHDHRFRESVDIDDLNSMLSKCL